MNVRAFARRDMDSHTRAAEQKRSFILAFRNHRAYAKSHSVEHKVGIVGVAVLFNAHVEDFPTLLFEVSHNRLFKREAREIRVYYKIFVFNCLHFSLNSLLPVSYAMQLRKLSGTVGS